MCILLCKCDAVWENKILDLTQEALTKSVPADGIFQMYFQTNSLYFDWKNHFSSVCDQWWFWKKKEHLMIITGLQFSILDLDKFIKQIQIHFFNEIWCVFNFLPAWENLLGFSGKKKEKYKINNDSYENACIFKSSFLCKKKVSNFFTGPGAIMWLPQCQWKNSEKYG